MGLFIDMLLYSTSIQSYIHAYDINTREEHKNIYSFLRISVMTVST
jgi:hypothetical protein